MTDTNRSDRMPPRLPGALPPEALDTPPEALRRNWGWIVALGVLLILGGTAAAVVPVAASIAVEALVGATLLVCGAAQIWQAVRCEGWRCRVISIVAGAVYAGGGVLIALDPLAGLVALTIVFVSVMLASGVLRIAMAVRQRPEQGWGWTMAGGVLTALVSGALIPFLPAVSLTLLGLVAAVSLIVDGTAHVALGLAARRMGGGASGDRGGASAEAHA